MYFPKSRKLVLTAGLLALGTFTGCSMNKSYLHCPSFVRSWRSSSEETPEPIPADASEPLPAMEVPTNPDSTAPVIPEILLEDVPRAAPQDSSKPMGPQLPPKTISVPKPGAFNAPQFNAPQFNTSETPSVEEFFDEQSPGDAYQNVPSPSKIPSLENKDAPAEAPIPEGLQSSIKNPSLLKRFQDGIPRIGARPTQKTQTQATQVGRSSRLPATPQPVAKQPTTNPTPDPISYLVPPHQQRLAQSIAVGNDDDLFSNTSAKLTKIQGRVADERTVSSQEDDWSYGDEQASDFEFEFDSPPSPISIPEPWPYSPSQRR